MKRMTHREHIRGLASRRLASLRGETLPAVGAAQPDGVACRCCGYHVCKRPTHALKSITIGGVRFAAHPGVPGGYVVGVDMGGKDATVVHVVGSRPAVGSTHAWDVARADMEAHSGAAWHPSRWDDVRYRIIGGNLKVHSCGDWLCSDLLPKCYRWTRLPDEPVTRTDAIRARYAGEERVRFDGRGPITGIYVYVGDSDKLVATWSPALDGDPITTGYSAADICERIDRALEASR